MPWMDISHPCPWCDTSPTLYFSLMAGCAIIGMMAGLWFGRGRPLVVGALVSVFATVFALVLEAFVQGLIVGYPHGLPGLLVGG